MTSIFMNSNTNVEDRIIFFCNVDSLLQLSGVNQPAYKKLSNDGFFKKYYEDHFPRLQSFHLFTLLHSVHPSYDWKVICRMMGLRSINQLPPYDKDKLTIIQAHLNAKKELVKSTIDEIDSCMSKISKNYYECVKDVSSLSDEIKHSMKEQKSISNKIESKRTKNQWKAIETAICKNPDEFLSEGKWTKIVDVNIQKSQLLLLSKLVELHFRINDVSLQYKVKLNESASLRKDYNDFYSKRYLHQEKINHIEGKMTALNSKPAKCHRFLLVEEFYEALEIDNAVKSLPHLIACMVLIQQITDHPEEQTSENFNSIRHLIGACSKKEETLIWGLLYEKEINGLDIEDSWTDDHFKIFLPDLKVSISKVLAQCSAIIENAPPRQVENSLMKKDR